jgi:hypothetical protein
MAADASPPTLDEVVAAISGLHNTAPGADGINAQLLKLGAEAVAKELHAIISDVWASGYAPQAWKEALLVALHKKGCRLQPDNYRGITLLEVMGKVYVTVIHNRIRKHLCNQLLDAQHGFRPGSGTNGAICFTGGGGGWYGGGAGLGPGGGGGGSGHLSSQLLGGSMLSGVRAGHGLAVVEILTTI